MDPISAASMKANSTEEGAVLRTAEYFQERAIHAEPEWFRQFLETGRGDELPRVDDEIPEELTVD